MGLGTVKSQGSVTLIAFEKVKDDKVTDKETRSTVFKLTDGTNDE